MSTTFSRSMRAIVADGFRGWGLGLLCVLALGLVWTAWFLFARVTLYEVSETARLEVDQETHPVEAQIDGRVTASHLVLDAPVHQGDVLVELDDRVERLELKEASVRVAALSPRIDALHSQIDARDQALADARGSSQAEIDAARARLEEAKTSRGLAVEEAGRYERLGADLVSELDLARVRAEARRRQAQVDAASREVKRLEAALVTRVSEGRAEIEALKGELAELEGALATAKVALEQREQAGEKWLLRAPVDGRIGELVPLKPGTMVRQGDRLAGIIPAGQLRVIAEFPAPRALGRIRPGQPARVRLEGFPWTQYGSIPARVHRLAGEARDGRVRVELSLLPDSDTEALRQHGLPATVEVEVDQVSPAGLVLRTAGQMLASQGQQPDAGEGG